MENKDRKPIYYKNAAEMDKPLSELMEDLRTDIGNVRGKLHDIKFAFGWKDRIEHLEGGLTCMLVAMHSIMEEWKEFEKKQNAKKTSDIIPTWLKEYSKLPKWIPVQPDIDFSKETPTETDSSLHVYEEIYQIGGDTYRLLYAIGDNSGPIIEKLKK